jgi:hypothetical protein
MKKMDLGAKERDGEMQDALKDLTNLMSKAKEMVRLCPMRIFFMILSLGKKRCRWHRL